MNAEKSLKLARRFIELPLEKRRLFLDGLRAENIDFSLFPIPSGVAAEDRQALSYAQQRMWVLWQLDPASGAYNLPGAVRLRGALDRSALERAFTSLIERHETLRTVFKRRADERLEQVPAEWVVPVDLEDFSVLVAAEREQAVAAEAQRQSLLPFDLENGPLLRVKLLKLDEHEHVLLLTLHHIVSDGWSMNVLIDEFIRCYDAHEQGLAPQLAELPIQYSDYALWQRRWLEAGEQERQLAYWLEQLGDEHPVLELLTDHPRPALPSYRGTRYEFAVAPQLAEQLRGLAQRHQVTLFMVLLGAFNILLHRYTGQTDLRVGVPIANRNRREVEGLIGFFVNTQVLRTRLAGQQSVAQLLQQVKETALGAQAHQELPFERLVEALKLERSLSHTPLFQVMYNHQPQVADIQGLSSASGLELGLIHWQGRTTQFDLSLDTYEQGGRLQAALTYASDLFEAATIERMAEHWTQLLHAMVQDPQQRIGELAMLSAEERQVLVHDWNATAQVYPTERCLHELIAEQVRRSPDAPALAFGARQLSYAQLDAQANQWAHWLRERGVGPDVLVGIAAERSLEMVIGLLAILKAGGAYLPLDPEYPRERLAYMIEDSGIHLLLTQQALLAQLPVDGLQVQVLDQADGWLQGYSEQAPQVAVDSQHLAYVIYTSGSTGKPKGAGNSHGALVNRLCWMQQAYGLEASDSVLQKTPFSFDVSVWEFFWPLLSGARLVMAAPGEHRDPALLIDTIVAEGISTLHFVPSMLQAFIHQPGVEACRSLKRIVCSGEALPLDAQQQVFAKLPEAGLFNLYGPTEAAIDVTHWTCVDEGREAVPIGRPIANLRMHVLDAELQPVPAGVAGELYLGGAGLARSYHRRPALSAERFVPCPFHSGQRLYRTGDRVRQRRDGVIDYLGRLDHQVKLRGLRIELGEIEARLLQHSLVREAVVLVQDGKSLVAYLVLQDGEKPEDWSSQLKAWLLVSLPEYMVPTYLMLLEKLPVTANGKLDRRALPAPQSNQGHGFVAPVSSMEKALALIWQEVLGLEQVGVDDNFFELGGDSIISIQVVSRARQAGIALNPRDLFQYQNVRSLAQVAVLATAPAVDQGAVSGEVLLTPVQQRFFEQVRVARDHWNQSILLTPRETLQAPPLQAALKHLLQHHDALRLQYQGTANGWRQWQGAAEPGELWLRRAESPEALSALCEAAQQSLDLQQGPLLRALLVQMADGSQRLLLVIHHLVVDGVSWRVLLEDLQQLYRQLSKGGTPGLPAKTWSYQAWAEQLQAHVPQVLAQLPYWRAQQQGALDLPCDNPQGSQENRHGQTLHWRLDATRTRQLLQQAPAAYRTQVNDLLLTALARVICRWSGHPGALIELEGHGREELVEGIDLTRTVGWFTSLFPVLLQPQAELGDALKCIKEQLRAVPGKGLGYGLLRYLGGAEVSESLAGLGQPRITFNYLGQFDRQFDDRALWQPATERSGAAQDPSAPLANWLTLEGQVYGGELALQWGFSTQMFEPATVQRLVDAYGAELEALIEHCCTRSQSAATPSDFPLARLSQAQLDGLSLDMSGVEDLYPLAPLQQGLLFHTLYEEAAGAYINQLQVTVHNLDPQRFRDAWQATLDAHEVLRSSVLHQGELEQALQVVHKQVRLPFVEYDWRQRPDQASALAELAAAQRAQGFDLAQAPLLRVVLVRTAEQSHQLIYTHHHILLDGWSNSQLLGEVLQRYAGQAVATTPGRYRDYIAWLSQQDAQQSEAFWSEQLAGLQAPTRLAQAVERHTEVRSDSGHGLYEYALDLTQTQRLSEFARSLKVTLNTLVQGAWLLLLQRHTGQQTVAMGTTVAGRPAALPGVESQLGLFINTLPLVASPQPEDLLGAWLQALQACNVAMREQEHTPLFDIQRWAGHGGESLFDTLLVFENYPIAETLQRGAPEGLSFGEVGNHEQTNYPLALGVHLGQTLALNFSYARHQLRAASVEQLAQQFGHLLLGMATAGSTAPLGTLHLVDQAVQLQRLEAWQDIEQHYPVQRCIHQLIEDQALAQPEALAMVMGDQRLSYGQLNRQANQLAHRLIAAGVGPDVRVGIALERGATLLVGLLAILKSGGAYVPLDPQYPADRLAYMIEDSGLQLLLTRQSLLAQLPQVEHLPVLLLEADDACAAQPEDNPQTQVQSGHLAYVIYTSGSTGQPKGVAIAHDALVMHCLATGRWYEMTPADCELHFLSFAFDGAHERWLTSLVMGGSLLLRDDSLWTPAQTYEAIRQHGVTMAGFPPAYLQQLAEHAEAVGNPPPVRLYSFGGEAMPQATFELVSRVLRPQLLINGYGPTETVVTPLVWKARCGEPCPTAYAPIGHCVGQRRAYVLDAALNLVPHGATGELYLGGEGLARGYLQRPQMTAERFVADPFDTQGGRLYRTGDLVRQGDDGALEYVGRIDQQVKIRGFRIELGEIEARLLELPEVSEAIVMAQPGPLGPQLVAYVVAATMPADLPAQAQLRLALRERLSERLPAYMLPAHWLLLAQLPQLPNGKLDRKALPKVEPVSEQAYEAPQGDLEQRLAQLWAGVLKVDQVGRNHHFFELGGHSLLAVTLVSRIQLELGIKLTPQSLFQMPVLSDFASHLHALTAQQPAPDFSLLEALLDEVEEA
ncbi:non-ribosomal peptide synthetase [Pseudomonas chlororaphis]|nr:non-ribosomal peptide synthetase [Pseudomonas chlororaphis]